MEVSMRLNKIGILFAAAMVLNAATVWADQVDNPRFAAWTKFAVGSSETLQGNVQSGGMSMTFSVTYTLSDKADDHVTLDVSTAMQMFGQQHTTTRSETVPSTYDSKDVQVLPDEKVDAAGKTFDCKVYQIPDSSGQGATAKIWANVGIPGGLVKMDASGPRGAISYLLQSYIAK
jgi:hypothetical protein